MADYRDIKEIVEQKEKEKLQKEKNDKIKIA